MPPTPKDLAKYARVAAAYHDPVRGQSLRALATRYRTTPTTIAAWLRAVGRPPRAQGTHGPAEVGRMRVARIVTLATMARVATQRAAAAAREGK